MELTHFSHEHPLIFNEEKNVEDKIDRNDFCNICHMPILLSSFYRCSHTGCKYLLHQPCALLLTETLIHPWLPSHGFCLREKLFDDHSYCKRCHQPCENFTYNYIASWPVTGIPIFHPMCAIPLQIKSKHKSHPLHPLVAVGKKISAVCDACAQEQKGYFFACHECGFFIHVDCALLPRIVKCKKHSHYLILTYACCDRYQYEYPELKYCLICSDNMSGSGAYSCGKCNGFVHLKCAINDMEDLGTETELQVVDLPGDDPNAFRSGMIQRLRGMEFDDGDGNLVLERILHDHPGNLVFEHKLRHRLRDHPGNLMWNLVFEHKLRDHPGNLVFEHKLHDHPLILHKEIENSGCSGNDQEPQELIITLCNACLQPIYPPFFSCTLSLESGSCHFHLHQSCACLPPRIKFGLNRVLELNTWSKETLCSLFNCSTCHLLGNGFHYQKTLHVDEPRPSYHIACCSAPNIVKHVSHKQHVLHLTSDASWFRVRNCCSVSDIQTFRHHWIELYRCIDCDFAIDKRCALLPIQVNHRFDPHPLNLITTCIPNNNYTLCEFCEENINTQFWHYGCERCDNFFHINCMPSVGSLSKVKFGNSITVSCHPSHPVTFIRMLELGSQRCGYCKKTIEGFVDAMAFLCSKCDFWMHFRCAEKLMGSQKY